MFAFLLMVCAALRGVRGVCLTLLNWRVLCSQHEEDDGGARLQGRRVDVNPQQGV